MDSDTKREIDFLRSHIERLHVVTVILGSCLVEIGVKPDDLAKYLQAAEARMPKKYRHPIIRGDLIQYAWEVEDEARRHHKKPRRGDA